MKDRSRSEKSEFSFSFWGESYRLERLFIFGFGPPGNIGGKSVAVS